MCMNKYEVLQPLEVTDESDPLFGSHEAGATIEAAPSESVAQWIEQGFLKLVEAVEGDEEKEETPPAPAAAAPAVAPVPPAQQKSDPEPEPTAQIAQATVVHPATTATAAKFKATPAPFDGSVADLPAISPALFSFCSAIMQYEGYVKPGENQMYPLGTRSYLDNNPGNLRYEQQPNTIAEDKDSFAVFKPFPAGPIYAYGFEALAALVLVAIRGNGRVYKSPVWDPSIKENRPMNIGEFFAIYSPVADHNDPVKYAAFVCEQLSEACGETIAPTMPLNMLTA
jgi:hypothetical protein